MALFELLWGSFRGELKGYPLKFSFTQTFHVVEVDMHTSSFPRPLPLPQGRMVNFKARIWVTESTGTFPQVILPPNTLRYFFFGPSQKKTCDFLSSWSLLSWSSFLWYLPFAIHPRVFLPKRVYTPSLTHTPPHEKLVGPLYHGYHFENCFVMYM